MIPLLAMASLLAGAAYFGLPDAEEDTATDGPQDQPDPDQDLSDGGLLNAQAGADDGLLDDALFGHGLLEILPAHAPESPASGSGNPAGEPTKSAADQQMSEANDQYSAEGLFVYEGSGGGASLLQEGPGENILPPGLETTASPSADDGSQALIHTDGAEFACPDGSGETGAADDAAPGGDATDTVREVLGTDGADVLRAGTGDRLIGGNGSDRLIGGAGSDHLIGGAGDDSLSGAGGGNIVEGGDGSDILIGVEADYDPAMGLHRLLTPAEGPSLDRLDGGDGDDVLRMGHGDVGVGGAGDDLFFVQGDAVPDNVALPRIEDFDVAHDRLVLAVPFTEAQIIASWPETPIHDAEVTVRNFEDGTGATIFVDGEAVADVVGAQGMDPGTIRLVGSDMVGADMMDLKNMQDDETWWSGLDGDQTARALMDRPTA
jgi:Ca2+-binding RTX toxin-like protein